MSNQRGSYTSIPTFGLQKRGFGKKSPVIPTSPSGATPDFTGVTSAFQGYQAPNFNTAAVPASPSYLQQTAPTVPSQQAAPINRYAPASYGFDMSAQNKNAYPMACGVNPIGNSAPLMNPMGNTVQSQGYVPPAQNQQAPYQSGRPVFSAYPAFSSYQTVNPFMVQNAAQQAAPASDPSGWNQLNAPAGRAAAAQNNAGWNPVNPSVFQTAQVQDDPSAPPNASGKAKMDDHRLFTILMLVLLPVSFAISCFYQPFFFVFITLSLISAGVLWYKELYSPVFRTLLTVVLSGLCIFGVTWMIINGDNRSYQDHQNQPVQVQANVTNYSNDEVDFLTPEPEVTPEPVIEKTRAQTRLEGFMDLWATNDPEQMVAFVQPSWVNKQTEPATALFKLLANRTATGYTIEEVGGTEADTSRTIVLTATIDKNTGKTPSIYRFTVMMVQEGDEWYVNPSSLQSNDEVETTEENVVNNSNASGLATMPPRTTVTPAPPADTILYYNANGGNYYHMDANCPSVKTEFLPLTGTFTYSELRTYRNSPWNLQPCLKCHAPTSYLSGE